MKIDLALKNIISAWLFINETSGMCLLPMRESLHFIFVSYARESTRRGCCEMHNEVT